MDLQFLRSIRKYELERVLPLIPEGSCVLEIGAGMGWQARDLDGQGFKVEAIEVADSTYIQDRVWPVKHYDGVKIPYPDDSFDVVFSSNVLEHMPDVEKFQDEIKRVGKPDALAIHLLPTSSWRFWTTVTYYPYLCKQFLYLLKRDPRIDLIDKESLDEKPADVIVKKWKKIFPARHGEQGNVITELYLFSRFSWAKLFERTGWTVQAISPAGLFYTGGLTLGKLLSIEARHLASYMLGSSCLVYVLKKR